MDTPAPTAPDTPPLGLTGSEKRLLSWFRQLPPDVQRMTIELVTAPDGDSTDTGSLIKFLMSGDTDTLKWCSVWIAYIQETATPCRTHGETCTRRRYTFTELMSLERTV